MKPKFQKKILNNGITLIHEFRDLPVVSLSISNKFGAAQESSDIKGIAHVIEHLVFTGTKTRTHEDISREIEKKGGVLNAFTSNEVTSFWFKLPSEHLFSGLDILTDILNNPIFDKTKFEKEKRVILQEINMYLDDPKSDIYEKILTVLYEKPFGLGIIGSPNTVSNLKHDFVLDYFKKNYSPENFIVTVVGNADFNKLCDYLEKNFSSKNSPISKPTIKLITNQHKTKEVSGLDQAHFMFAIHSPLPKNPQISALEVLDAYLASGMSSKLFLEIREKRGLAYAVRSSLDTEKNYAHYLIYVGTTKSAIPEVKKIILDEFKKIEKMTQKDLEEAKTQLIGLKKVRSEESINVMNELMYNELANKAEDYYEHEKKINEVTLDQVKSIAKIKDFSTFAIVPK
jgi:predicted Zn-dependent peptidase